MTLLVALTLLISYVSALTVYDGPIPQLPHAPFGYGAASTGGSLNASATYIVTNASELREAIAVPWSKTIYVKGIINGNELADGTLATCQDYIDMTGADGAAIRSFNFTLYLLSLNTTYTSLVSAAAAQNETFEGMNATDYRALLAHQNGWRPVVQQTQKAHVGFSLKSNMSLIGLDNNAALNGINLYLNTVDNVWIRNLKIVSPSDCTPAPETFPATWNANFDAIGLVTATTVWVDSCSLQDQLSGEYVQPDEIYPGWQVDRFDGLFDCEDGSDNVTFSHNIIQNHHKSMLMGGGTKEADRDLGKMKFTIFGNHFNNSASRNPLMRFGTFDVFANLYESLLDSTPVFVGNATVSPGQRRRDALPSDAKFEYNWGVYNQSTAQIQDNVFIQTGAFAEDTSRMFTISESTDPALPARICVREPFPSTINGLEIHNMTTVANDVVDFWVSSGKSPEGAVLVTCEGMSNTKYQLPVEFHSASEVQAYVLREAGQH
ncbi:polysaccharide lyase family 1 protein [Mycena floridula]|nr:polysaccharide lyase family 1 protein [Mycena floridula]